MIKNDDDHDGSFKSPLSSFLILLLENLGIRAHLEKSFSFSDFITKQLLSGILKASYFLEKVVKIISIENFWGNSKQFSQN